MNKYDSRVYLISCLTNLHMGSGDSNYGIIDNQVQRDATTNLPTIHSSGLKGALRQFFEDRVEDTKATDYIFGTPPKTDGTNIKSGSYRFLSADLLAIPKPNPNPKGPLYQLVSSQQTLERIRKKMNIIGVEKDLVEKIRDSYLKSLDEYFVKNLVVHPEDSALQDVTEDLPIIARNHLENSISQNLWYEEIVPKASVFVCIIQVPIIPEPIKEEQDPENQTTTNFEERFDEVINDKVIQFGANASIGYGLCHFKKLV